MSNSFSCPPKFEVNDPVVWQYGNLLKGEKNRSTLFDGYGFIIRRYWIPQDGEIPYFARSFCDSDGSEIESKFRPNSWLYQISGTTPIARQAQFFWIDEDLIQKITSSIVIVDYSRDEDLIQKITNPTLIVDYSGVSHVQLKPTFAMRPIEAIALRGTPTRRVLDMIRPSPIVVQNYIQTLSQN